MLIVNLFGQLANIPMHKKHWLCHNFEKARLLKRPRFAQKQRG
jgi:hypothetical protein